MRKLLLAACIPLFALCVAPQLNAQILSVYGTFSDLHASSVPTGTAYGLGGASTPNSTSLNAPGVGGGVTLRLLPLGPVALGLDLRGSTKPGTAGADSAFAGLKLSFRPPLSPFKIYVQGSGGYIATRTTNTTTYAQDPPGPPPQPYNNQYAAYEIFAGVDYHRIHFFDLRIVEVGGGKAYLFRTLNDTTFPSTTLFTINSGLVFHF